VKPQHQGPTIRQLHGTFAHDFSNANNARHHANHDTAAATAIVATAATSKNTTICGGNMMSMPMQGIQGMQGMTPQLCMTTMPWENTRR